MNIQKFIADAEKIESEAMFRRWLYGLKEQRRLMLVRIINLEQYDIIPDGMKAEYASLRAECLKELEN